MQPVSRAADKPAESLRLATILEEQRRKNVTRAITIRLPIGDLERARQLAEAKGIRYQTVIRMLLHEALAATPPQRC